MPEKAVPPGQMPSSFDSDPNFHNERTFQKIGRKLVEEPLIPLGAAATIFAFVQAYKSIRRGDSTRANKFFRLRVAAQGFTVLAMLAGSMYYQKDREKTTELRKLKSQQEAEEKHQKWIRELEARDEEERSRRAAIERRRQKPQQEAGEKKSSGGVLAALGLWTKPNNGAEKSGKAKQEEGKKPSPAENARSETTTADAPSPPKKERKENPRSSLGTIGQIVSKQSTEPEPDKKDRKK